MPIFRRFDSQHLPLFARNWRQFILWGIAMILIGAWALYASTFATLITVVAIGFIIFLSGCVQFLDTITFWRGKWGGFTVHLILAFLYLAVGLMLMNNPVSGSVSITLLLGVFYIIAGIFRLMFSSSLRLPRWGWAFSNGILSLILGILILSSWPDSSIFIIGLFVGIDLIFSGCSYLVTGIAAKELMR